ncbi:MAG: winged helix-turn-helix transcriptional regulator [Burkholderiales bacterium]|nr:winged helix-turn-helix transcriptional regulator [Burkholderiales bacterium]
MNRRNPSPSVPDPNAVAVTELTLAVFRLNGVLLHWGDKLVAPLGLTSARWQVLGAIALADTPLTAPQVGGAMGVTRQGAQKQLNLLTEQGLVKPHPNPANQRSPFYALTPEGRARYRKVDALWVAKAAELAALIPATQASTAARTLESMLRALTVPPFSKAQP